MDEPLESVRAAAEARVAQALHRVAQLSQAAPTDGLSEGAALQAAYDALVGAHAAGVERFPHAASAVFMRLAAHDWLARMGDLGETERRLAEKGESVGVHMQTARLGPAAEDRIELLRQRRAWGRALEARTTPVVRAPRGGGGKRRIGFVTDELRQTNVGVFAWPLFEHRDRERFELFVYTRQDRPEDPIQALFRGWTDVWRCAPGATPQAMAELIAADGLDMLIELGAEFSWQVAAHRPAPIQASWLGYPTSVGLSAIDYFIADPHLAPEDPRMMLEQPLLAPHCWLAMTEAYFEAEPPLRAEIPEARNGVVTFGTMNGVFKMSAACLDLWAQVVAAEPGSRFLFVRPEAGAAIFRENVRRIFGARGVAPDRILFAPIRGRHLPYYDEIDVSLDTFPVTGGTTTCESLWMGVPVVSLVGAAPFERVSYSVLASAGLGHLAARTPQAFFEIATALARDRPGREAMRRDLRRHIRAHPIGRPEAFAKDFYDMLAKAIR